MNCREIIDIIFNIDDFVITNDEKNENDSFYKTIETNDVVYIVRLSNHKSYCQNWVDRTKKRYKNKTIKRISIVIEDEKTEANNRINIKLKNPIVVNEYVFKNYETPLELFEVHRIAKAVNNIPKVGVFENPVSDKSEEVVVKSENPIEKIQEGIKSYVPLFEEFCMMLDE